VKLAGAKLGRDAEGSENRDAYSNMAPLWHGPLGPLNPPVFTTATHPTCQRVYAAPPTKTVRRDSRRHIRLANFLENQLQSWQMHVDGRRKLLRMWRRWRRMMVRGWLVVLLMLTMMLTITSSVNGLS